jgi:hypothetical protein
VRNRRAEITGLGYSELLAILKIEVSQESEGKLLTVDFPA